MYVWYASLYNDIAAHVIIVPGILARLACRDVNLEQLYDAFGSRLSILPLVTCALQWRPYTTALQVKWPGWWASFRQ